MTLNRNAGWAPEDWIARWASYSPNRPALIDGETGITCSYSDLLEYSTRLASFLKTNFGLTEHSRVAAIVPNSLEYVGLFFALQRIGACLVPVNPKFTQREIQYILNDSCADLVLVDSSSVDKCPSQNRTLDISKIEMTRILADKSIQAFFEFKSEENSPALVLYTSGTTGFPKGALLSLKMLFWNSINTSLRLKITQDDRAVIFLPLFHTGGWNVLTTPFLHHGATVILTKKFEPNQVLALSEKHRATLIFGVPTTMDMMVQSPLFDVTDLRSVRYAIVGGEPMPIPLIEKWHAKGVMIRQGYGLTEFGPNVFSLNEEDAIRKIGSVGLPNFYVNCKVVGSDGQAVKTGDIGELCLSGPTMMSGYLNNQAATQETIQNGWLHTGDLVRQDEDGYFYIVGRKKEMFISGGENVYPSEVESVLRSITAMKEVAVVGVPDPKWGEVGKAFLVSDGSVSISDITAFCEKNLAKFKIPKYFEFLDTLPKSDSGKILKKQLKEQSSVGL